MWPREPKGAGGGLNMAGKGHPIFASLYDHITRFHEKHKFSGVRRRLVGHLTGDILEIGAGTGKNLPYYSPEAAVTALEPDPYMMRRGERMASPATVTWVEGRAEELPFIDGSFDAVVFTLVLCSVGSVEKSLEEARRVLRPRGRLVFFEHVRSERHAKTQNFLNPAWRFFGAGCNLNRDTRASIETAGFEIKEMSRGKIVSLMPTIYGWAETVKE